MDFIRTSGPPSNICRAMDCRRSLTSLLSFVSRLSTLDSLKVETSFSIRLSLLIMIASFFFSFFFFLFFPFLTLFTFQVRLRLSVKELKVYDNLRA